MNKIFYLLSIFIFILSCSLEYSGNIFKKKNIIEETHTLSIPQLSKNNNINDYKNKLLKYSKNNKFPDINK